MHTLSSRTNMPRGVVVYADKRGDVASFPAFLNGHRMPLLADVIKLCKSAKPLSSEVRAARLATHHISPAALESHPYVVIVDDIPCIFKTRGEAAQFATEQMYAPHVSRVESAHLRFSKDGKRFL